MVEVRWAVVVAEVLEHHLTVSIHAEVEVQAVLLSGGTSRPVVPAVGCR